MPDSRLEPLVSQIPNSGFAVPSLPPQTTARLPMFVYLTHLLQPIPIYSRPPAIPSRLHLYRKRFLTAMKSPQLLMAAEVPELWWPKREKAV